ncbi:MAG: site-specific DNA-methyltransferase, partial [Candidatus Bathyarchaeota archaeon]|nr:site-specific DNA-methyltransferase [Candidatus Bathyarchaeota archaeon]
ALLRKPCEGKNGDNLRQWNTGGLRMDPDKMPFLDVIISETARGNERKIAPHPTLKPQRFMRRIVWSSLPLGKGVILDPFCGSGSTIAAAESLGLESIGIENDKEYYEMAKIAIPLLSKLKVDTWEPKLNKVTLTQTLETFF